MQAIKDQFDALYEEGKTNGRVMAIALHPFIIFLLLTLDNPLA